MTTRPKKAGGNDGRFQPGEANIRVKLRPEEVLELRHLRRMGWSFQALAKHFNVTVGCTFPAATGRTWRDVQ